MLRAFIEKELQENAEVAVEFYNHALEVLKWGAERWERLPNSPGVFQPTFVRGIKCLRLDALMDVRLICILCGVYAHMRCGAIRLVSRIPAGSLTTTYSQAQTSFSPNSPMRQQNHPCPTPHSSCRSSSTKSEKHTRELQNMLRVERSGLIG